MKDFHITPEAVAVILIRLDPHMSASPGAIHLSLLRLLSSNISTTLANLFNNSLEKGIIPDDLQRAQVIPVFKAGKKTLANNYQPIRLTFIFY